MAIRVQDLERLLGYFTLIHHARGRIRLRVDPAIRRESKTTSSEDLMSFMARIPGIKNFKLNSIVASITIEYDEQIFPASMWEDLLNRRNLNQIVERIDTLAKEMNAKC
ncbi:MAG: HMA2 domain-containing protein [Wolinella sp.]